MKQFLEGPAGTGKTTQAVEQLNQWLRTDVPPQEILVLVPQRTLGRPYQRLLWQSDIPNAASVQVATIAGIAQRALSLYWPMVASKAIPDWDGREPTFLNVETSQYYMTRFVEPEIQAGLFDGLSMSRPRLVTQILDGLAKSAVNSFPLDEVAARLSAAWVGPSSRLRLYSTALNVAKTFREYCLKYSLLDFAQQIELFQKYLMPDSSYREYARTNYRYLIADNIEEMSPVVHDFVEWLWPTVADATLIYDTEAGYRLFLGAAPELAYNLKPHTETQSTLTQPLQQDEHIASLENVLRHTFALQEIPNNIPNPTLGFTHQFQTFYPQMINWVTDTVADLVKSGVEPREIVILAPFLSDALRFSIFRRLEEKGVPYISHRPSRAIRDEPVARAMITLMRIAYGTSETMPHRGEVARALSEIIDDLDPIRAELLSQVVYRGGELSSFEQIQQPMQSRISYLIGERYENLRRWILEFRQTAATVPPDYFMQRLFDFAAHIGYRFHTNLEAGRIVAELIDSAYRFRQVIAPMGVEHWGATADEYGRLVGEGTLAAVHDADLYQEEQNAVFVAPAYTFLMRNRMVDYQFWLDASSNAWAERLDQPLTHPYVLRRDYPAGQPWTDEQEIEARDRMLERLLLGLIRRCRKHLYLGFADLGEHGFEQRGALLRIFNHLLQVFGDEEETNEES